MAGADVVEGYVHDPASTGEPPEQLRAFSRVSLGPGQTKIIRLVFRPSAFAYLNSGPATGTAPGTTSPTTPSATSSPQPPGRWTIAGGVYRVDVGGSASEIDDSAVFYLRGSDTGPGLNGLFGWRLTGSQR
jgi:hypothetical protein